MPANLPLGSLSAFLGDLDDWCGTRPPRKFPPRPKAFEDIMIAVLVHRLSERVGNAQLRGQLQKVAADLHAAGVKQSLG